MLLHFFTSQKEPKPNLDLYLDGICLGTFGLVVKEQVVCKAAASVSQTVETGREGEAWAQPRTCSQ